MMTALANPLKFFIIAGFVGPLPFRKTFAQSGKEGKQLFPKEKPVNLPGMPLRQRFDRVESANGQFIG
jgi:hypothetical protein